MSSDNLENRINPIRASSTVRSIPAHISPVKVIRIQRAVRGIRDATKDRNQVKGIRTCNAVQSILVTSISDADSKRRSPCIGSLDRTVGHA